MYYLVVGSFIIGWSNDYDFLESQKKLYGGIIKQSKHEEAKPCQ